MRVVGVMHWSCWAAVAVAGAVTVMWDRIPVECST